MRTLFFFFKHSATPEIYTLSLHDALPIFEVALMPVGEVRDPARTVPRAILGALAVTTLIYLAIQAVAQGDRKSTRLNSSHVSISYAVFCLKKKKTID